MTVVGIILLRKAFTTVTRVARETDAFVVTHGPMQRVLRVPIDKIAAVWHKKSKACPCFGADLDGTGDACSTHTRIAIVTDLPGGSCRRPMTLQLELVDPDKFMADNFTTSAVQAESVQAESAEVEAVETTSVEVKIKP